MFLFQHRLSVLSMPDRMISVENYRTFQIYRSNDGRVVKLVYTPALGAVRKPRAELSVFSRQAGVETFFNQAMRFSNGPELSENSVRVSRRAHDRPRGFRTVLSDTRTLFESHEGLTTGHFIKGLS